MVDSYYPPSLRSLLSRQGQLARPPDHPVQMLVRWGLFGLRRSLEYYYPRCRYCCLCRDTIYSDATDIDALVVSQEDRPRLDPSHNRRRLL